MSLEKAIAAAVEPVVDAILDVEKRLDNISLIPGPKGEDADVEEVVDVLFAKYSDRFRGIPGAVGERGEAGGTPTPEEVASALLARFPGEIRGDKGERGEDGTAPSASEVAETLFTTYKDALTGEKGAAGEPGEKGEPGEQGIHGTKGDPGEPGHQGLRGITGEKGDPGDPGEAGAPGEQGIPGIKGDPGERGPQGERGEKGEPGAPGEKGETGPKGDTGTIGEKGEKGDTGAAGAGIDVPVWEEGIYREGTIVQHDMGRYSRALKDTNKKPGTDDWQRIGSSGFAFRGVKSADTKYDNGDLFADGGSLFLKAGDKIKMVVQRGKDGEKGEKGDQGSRGYKGEAGPTGPKGDKGEKGDPSPHIVDFSIIPTGYAVVFSSGEVTELDLAEHPLFKEMKDNIDKLQLSLIQMRRA